MVQKVAAMSDRAMAEKCIDLWRDIYLKIMEDPPWVPVFNEKRYTMHSKRIARPATEIFVDPGHIPVHYDTAYVTDVQ